MMLNDRELTQEEEGVFHLLRERGLIQMTADYLINVVVGEYKKYAQKNSLL